MLPSSHGRRARPFGQHRQVVEGTVYRSRTGILWRDLRVDPTVLRAHQHEINTAYLTSGAPPSAVDAVLV